MADQATSSWVGIDTGGTFTDAVLYHQGQWRTAKVPSTPQQPEQAILDALADLGFTDHNLRIVHGTTVATNAVLEGKGARVAYITSHGFADTLEIGRGTRNNLYNLTPAFQQHSARPALRSTIGGRATPSGKCLELIEPSDIAHIAQALKQQNIDAIALNLLFGYQHPEQEQEVARQLAFDGFVSLSHEVMPRIGEYERGMATFLNAYVGPVMQRYLVALQQNITHTMPKASLSVLQSHGQRIGAEQAANQAVRLLLSGPAGGLHGAKAIGSRHGYTRLITLDMGGTSTDIAVIDGDIAVTEEGQIDTYPVHVPMVDMHTIGAGGGSIAFLDQAGVLQVGPASAGANPGPACYGLGGTSPTVTDAHVVLGTLPKHLKLGGSRTLEPDAAMQVYQELAAQMGVDVTTAAQGVIAVTSENMAHAARLMSVDHGHDPRQGFALMCFGGAGGLHACDVAEKLGCSTVLIPAQAGVLSAMGMLCAPFGRRQQTMLLQPLSTITAAQLQQKAQSLSNDIAQQLQQDQPGATIQFKTTLQVRYRGQGHALAVAGIDLENLRAAFEHLHQKRYGFTLDREIEIESLIQEGFCAMPQWQWPKWKQPVDRVPEKSVRVGGTRAVCWERTHLTPERRFTGPAVVTDPIGTTWISKNWQAHMADDGTLILSRQ